MTDAPQENALFVELVLVLQQSGWMALGKIQNPQTGKSLVDLPGASHAIDTLGMLKEKMAGKLTTGELGLLDNALTQLRLNYVEVSSEAADQAGEPEDAEKDLDASSGEEGEGS